MARQQPRLVNKQFNSPIGLYSEQNIKEILEKEAQMLANGAIGINFHNPMMTKPANLHNSAVLRMLEEEESKQRHQGAKRVAWPPPKEAEDEYIEQAAVETQGGAQYTSQTPGLQKSSPNNFQQNYQQARPATPQPFNIQTPQSPIVVNKPVSASTFSPTSANKTWAPVPSPQPYQVPQPIPQSYQSVQPQSPQPQATPQSQAVLQQPAQQQQQYRAPPAPVKAVEPPPSTITLRPQVPIRQAPAPIISSQPATATLRGGKHLRGDLKWPPEDVKTRMEAEQKHIAELSHGPACRPRRIQKDYSNFFAQHALNNSYPGYKVPPGTQYYEHHPMM